MQWQSEYYTLSERRSGVAASHVQAHVSEQDPMRHHSSSETQLCGFLCFGTDFCTCQPVLKGCSSLLQQAANFAYQHTLLSALNMRAAQILCGNEDTAQTCCCSAVTVCGCK